MDTPCLFRSVGNNLLLTIVHHQPPATTRMAVTSTSKKWLLKAEPDSRVVKGKDVKVRYAVACCNRKLNRRSSASMILKQSVSPLGKA